MSVTGQETGGIVGFHLCAYPPGTTDANLQSVSGVQAASMASGLNFVPSKAGVWYLAAGAGAGGSVGDTFYITVAVQHVTVVFTPATLKSKVSGVLSAVIRSPEGFAITNPSLVVKLHAYWKQVSYAPATPHVVATATPVNGIAKLNYHLPVSVKGMKLRMVVSISGGGYTPKNSKAIFLSVSR